MGTLNGYLAADIVTAVYSREAGETVLGGQYEISEVLSSSDMLSNYDITNNTADFTISPRPFTVSTHPNQFKYCGQLDPIFAYMPSEPLIAGTCFSGNLGRTAGEIVNN